MFLRDVKRAIRSGIRYLPGEGRAIVDAYRHVVLLNRRASAKLRSFSSEDQPPPETIFWIDPARIVHHTNFTGRGADVAPKDRVFDMQRDKGKVYGGSWDISQYPFADLDVVRAIRDRIEHRVDWRDTDFYSRVREDINRRGHTGWNIRSESDLEARCEHLDRLIDSIRCRGYLLNHTVVLDGEEKGLGGDPTFGSEITVNIGRSGEYLFQDGRHRLAVAKVLGVDKVPVKVLVRHKQWMEFRQFLRSLTWAEEGSSKPDQLYQNPLHPDLIDMPYAHSCEDRFAAMRSFIDHSKGALLDIGANLGYFCHRFEELGYSCFAVEELPKLALAADKIRIAEGKAFTVIAKDLFLAAEREPLRERHFQVVLGLNIFHHFLKKPDVFDAFVTWLGRLSRRHHVF